MKKRGEGERKMREGGRKKKSQRGLPQQMLFQAALSISFQMHLMNRRVLANRVGELEASCCC